MKHTRFLALAAVLGLNFMGFRSAQAGDIKYPEKTDPAFAFTVGDDAKSQIDSYGNLGVKFPRECGLYLAMIDVTPDMQKDIDSHTDPMGDLAKLTLQSAKAEITGKTAPVVIDGRNVTAYFAKKDIGGTMVDFKLIIVKVDDKHIATIGVVTAQMAPQADKDALDKLVGTIKFTKAK